MTVTIASFAAALVLAATVAYIGRFGFLSRHPRSEWLSAASGVTIGYVFLGILPKLGGEQKQLRKDANEAVPFLEHHIYFVAMLGVLVFYALALATHVSRRKGSEADASTGVFAATIGLYSAYVFLLGELLEATAHVSIPKMLVLAAALAFHFAGSDFGLRENHSAQYARRGRWVLAAATIAGWAAGLLVSLPEDVTAAMSAFLAGAIILNVLNDELPDAEHAHFVPFAAGAIVCGLLLASIG